MNSCLVFNQFEQKKVLSLKISEVQITRQNIFRGKKAHIAKKSIKNFESNTEMGSKIFKPIEKIRPLKEDNFCNLIIPLK